MQTLKFRDIIRVKNSELQNKLSKQEINFYLVLDFDPFPRRLLNCGLILCTRYFC